LSVSFPTSSRVNKTDADSFNPEPYPAFKVNPDPDLGFKIIFFYQKLQFTYPEASSKDVPATGEAFSPQKRTSSTSAKNEML
jgi:hypothetical protein